MKVKSSALFGLMVVICSISGFSLLKRFTQEVDEWRPSNLYSSTNLTRRSTFSVVSSAPASSSEAVATISSGSESLFGHGGAVLHAPASAPTYGLSPLASSPSGGLYTTSSAELRSFGGGGNGGGVSMSGGSVKSSGPSMASAGLGVSMPSTSMYAYNTNRNNSTANDVMSSVPGDIAMASTQAYVGIGNTTGGASRGISGRKNAPPSYGGDGNPNDNQNGDESGWGSTWLNWLDNIYGETGDRAFTWYELEGLYEQWRAAYVKNNPGAIPPTIDEWMAWFYGTSGDLTHIGGSGNEYTFLPVGDIMPILIMALMYIGIIAVRRYRKSQLNIEN